MNVIQWILDNLSVFAPWFIIKSYDWGVTWRLGTNPRPLSPGFHWRIPFADTLETVAATPRYIELPVQSIITKDGVLVCFAAMFAYKIEDPVKHFCEVDDFDEATEESAKAHLVKRVREQDYAVLSTPDGQLSLERSLQGTLSTRVKPWGTVVVDVGFVDFAKVPHQARVFGLEGVLNAPSD